MEDMRMVKFETLVKDVNERIRRGSNVVAIRAGSTFGSMVGNVGSVIGSMAESVWRQAQQRNYPMELIFNYETLNAYGKTVLENSQTDCRNNYPFEDTIAADSLQAARKMIQMYRGSGRDILGRIDANKDACSYNFIFWALFILAVDKSDFEERLSLICDYAKMLQISDEEVMDIVKVIEYIFREETCPKFLSETVPEIFEGVLEMYE